MTTFDLRKGMIDKDIYKIIDGRISGEGSEQILQFMFPRNEDIKDKPQTLHQIIKSNESFGIIKKFQTLWNGTEYYLTGISDENKYFIHLMPKDLAEGNLELNDIIDQINRKPEKFERIQGDILVKYIDIDSVEINERGHPRYTGIFKKKLKKSSLYPTQITIRDPFGMFWDYSWLNGIGNHRIDVEEGAVLFSPSKDGAVVFGTAFSLTHNEHAKVSYQIPMGKCALLSMQIGSHGQRSD